MAPPLHDWETFYVIVGSSAAALTGLQFVVVALLAEARSMPGGETEMQTFGTPTIVHFSAVLLIAAICSTPHQTATSLSICLVITGLGALVYGAWVISQARRVNYKAVLEDWIWHLVLPLIAYASLLVAGFEARTHPEGPLYVVAASALLLLYIGIHNAWDTAMYISITKRKQPDNDAVPPSTYSE